MKKNRLLYGVGVNDAEYSVHKYETVNGQRKLIWKCPYYVRWASMLRRVYSDILQTRQPTYENCVLYADWHYFTNFKVWMEKQDWEGKELDKDILVKGNKIYGPDTCAFVSKRVNTFLVDRQAERGEYPIGVSFRKQNKKFVAHCKDPFQEKSIYLGIYLTAGEAHRAWLNYKIKMATKLAEFESDPRVAKALIDRYENYKINLDELEDLA